MHICSYVKFSMFLLPSFLFFFFFFLSKHDCYRAKVAFVSCRFENPVFRKSYFSTAFNSKHKICRFNLSWMTNQFFNIDITIFTRLTRWMEKNFSHKYQLWKRNQVAAHARKGVKCPLGGSIIRSKRKFEIKHS